MAPPPTITQIRALAELVTAKVTITDARLTTLNGYLGDVKAFLMIRGDALLGPDLSKAKIISFDQFTKTMLIELPKPHLISYRLNHSATKLISLSDGGLWIIVPGDAGRTAALNRAYAEAEQTIADAAITDQTIDEAAIHAERALAIFLESSGWRVRFQSPADH